MRKMRKASRQMDETWALDVFRKAPYVSMSMVRPDGTPYCVAVNMAVKNESVFYFHCTSEGEKIDCIMFQPVVSLLAVSKCKPFYEEEKNNFTEHYDSAIAIGKASFVGDDHEKTEALRILCERFLPKSMTHFDEAIARSLDRTTVVKIDLLEPPVGKSKK